MKFSQYRLISVQFYNWLEETRIYLEKKPHEYPPIMGREHDFKTCRKEIDWDDVNWIYLPQGTVQEVASTETLTLLLFLQSSLFKV
jgi:hypothetical protein